MWQDIFSIGPITIHGYSLMLVIGFFLALQLAQFLARRTGLNPEAFVNAGLIALVSGIVGARLSHVIENWSAYTRADLSFGENFWNAINLTSGGLTYYGGFLLAFPITVLYGVKMKVPLRLGMDIIAPCLMIGLGFGRIGCFLNGCCYGAACELPSPLGVQYPYHSFAYVEEYDKGLLPAEPPAELKTQLGSRGEAVLRDPKTFKNDATLLTLAASQHSRTLHNAQIYSAFTALLLAAMLIAYFTLPHVPGRVFALMLMLEGATRFILEMLRDEPLRFGPLTLSMFIGLCLVAGGIVMWFAFGAVEKKYSPAGSASLSPA